jgi:hypothetical protein
MIERKDIAAHLENGVKTEFLVGTKGYTPVRGGFVRDTPSDGAYEIYTDMGAPPWPTQNAGKPGAGGTDARTGAPQAGSITGGRQVQLIGGEEKSLLVVNLDWEILTAITHNSINDDRAGNLLDWAQSAGAQFEKHKDYECFRALNTGAATTSFGPTYDTLSLFNDSHIDPGAEYQTAQDNSYALALDAANYKTVRVAGGGFLDGRGQPVGLMHNLIIAPLDLEDIVYQLVANREAYDTANREANPWFNRAKGLIAPGGWLDTTAWFLVDDSLPQKPINLQVRQQPRLKMWDDELAGDGGVRYVKFHARYTVFYGDWRLIIMGNT